MTFHHYFLLTIVLTPSTKESTNQRSIKSIDNNNVFTIASYEPMGLGTMFKGFVSIIHPLLISFLMPSTSQNRVSWFTHNCEELNKRTKPTRAYSTSSQTKMGMIFLRSYQLFATYP